MDNISLKQKLSLNYILKGTLFPAYKITHLEYNEMKSLILKIMGYKSYIVKLEGLNNPEYVEIVSKDKLSKGDSIKWVKLNETIWAAKKI